MYAATSTLASTPSCSQQAQTIVMLPVFLNFVAKSNPANTPPFDNSFTKQKECYYVEGSTGLDALQPGRGRPHLGTEDFARALIGDQFQAVSRNVDSHQAVCDGGDRQAKPEGPSRHWVECLCMASKADQTAIPPPRDSRAATVLAELLCR